MFKQANTVAAGWKARHQTGQADGNEPLSA